MRLELRLLLVYLIRLVFMGLAAWVALVQDSLGNASPVARAAFVALLLAFSVLVGEVHRLRTQFEMLMRALKAATAKATDPAGSGEAVTILIRALGSKDPDTRAKAHRNLIRLTGQTLPPDRAAWEAWWASEGRSAASVGGTEGT